jgi:hypothetical protein
MNHRIPLAATLAIAVALIAGVAAGCGSSNSDTTSTAAISKPEFLAKANAICKTGDAKQTAAQEALGKNPTQAEISNYTTNTLIPNVQAQIDQVKALGAPSGDEAKVNSMLALAQADLNKIKANPALINQGDQFVNFEKVAHPYGLTSCASGS